MFRNRISLKKQYNLTIRDILHVFIARVLKIICVETSYIFNPRMILSSPEKIASKHGGQLRRVHLIKVNTLLYYMM